MDIKQIKELIKVLETNKLRKLFIKKKDEEILIEKEWHTHTAHPLHHPSHRHVAEKPHSPSHEQGHVQEGQFITSPMVGTFYSRPATDQNVFVKVGDSVDEQTVVCIIEAMKVMNEVKANMKGVVKEILVQEGAPVEFGTNLFRIE